MYPIKVFLLSCAVLLVWRNATPNNFSQERVGSDSIKIPFLKGADVSFIPQIEDNGGIYKDAGLPKDPLQIFKEHGFNYIRLKLWHTPADGYNGLKKVLYMAARIKAQGLKLLLDFHYSDTWADPGHQQKPKAWENNPFDALKDSVYQYTRKVIRALHDQGMAPDIIQPGNEINAGILWNEGRVGGNYDSNWPNFAALLKQAIRGVRESGVFGDSIKIMIHIANAANNSRCRWFFDNLIANGVNFDIIGLSYYPWWHGTLSQVKSNLNDLSSRYQKDIVIAEYAYPWTLQWFDNQNNIVGSQSQLHAGYPASVEGQASFIRNLMTIVRQTKDGRGKGLFYWAPEYISAPTFLSNWENNALFDFSGTSLKSMDVFSEEPDSLTPVNVTMILNTATHWDTLAPHHFGQIRGEVEGSSYLTLPDGKKITWDASSDLVLENMGGDYWQLAFKMYPGDMLFYKFWTGYTRYQGTYLRLGWEGPIIPYAGAPENTRMFKAGGNDTTLKIQYYNSSNEIKLQYWTPFDHREDSFAVYFRVNMSGVMKSGRFDPSLNGPVGVRGDPDVSGGRLDWHTTKVFLHREEYSVYNGSFWSGVCYLPQKSIQVGKKLSYKFFIENDQQNGWENNIANRKLIFTASLVEQKKDTTLHWVYFDDSNPITELKYQSRANPVRFLLYQNYPNPFNSQTEIRYDLAESGPVTLKILNLFGEEVIELIACHQNLGRYSVLWNGRDASGKHVASGIYCCRLKTGNFMTAIKIILIR